MLSILCAKAKKAELSRLTGFVPNKSIASAMSLPITGVSSRAVLIHDRWRDTFVFVLSAKYLSTSRRVLERFPQSAAAACARCCGPLRHAHRPVSVPSRCRPTRRRTVVSSLSCQNLSLAFRLPRWRSSGRCLPMAGWPPCTHAATAGASSSRRYCCRAPQIFLSSQTSTMKSDDNED